MLASPAHAQPTVTVIQPSPNQASATRGSAVTIGFSQALSAGSTAGLRVFSSQRGGRRTGSSGTVTVSGASLIFTPAYDFKPGEVVRASVTTAVRSTSGALLAPRVFQFGAAATGGSAIFNGGPTAAGFNPYNVAMADVDNDGDLDLLAPTFGGASVAVRLNNGSGVFGGGSDPGVGSQPRSVATADLDGDGDLDLLTANYNANSVSVRFNNGSGTFGGGFELPAGSQPQSVAAADFDGDGDLDIVGTNGAGNSASVWLNSGSGTFGAGSTVAVGGFPFNVATGDVDNDGDLDFVTANWGGGSSVVSVRLNNGAGQFGAAPDVAVGSQPRWVSLSDLDNDGDLDLLSANYGSNSASVRFNNGQGQFGGGTDFPAGDSPSSIVAADIDGDSDLDLVVSNFYSNNLMFRLNNGTGTFGPSTTVPTGINPNGIAAADIDNDGDLDLLAANFSGNSVSVLLNQPPLPRAGIVGDSVVCNGGQVQLTATGTAPIVAYRWSTGATTASILVAQPGLYGVSVTFGGGTVGTAQYRVGAVALAARIAGDTLVCAGQPVSLSAVAAGARTYRWSTGATTPTISVSQAGTYSVVVSYGTGCASTAQQRVRAGLAGPVFSLGADTLACAGEAVVLRGPALSRPGLAYRWSDGSAGRTLRVTQAGTYSLQLLGECGTGPVSRRVDFRSCLTIPNVFTPNQDGRNDRFEIRGIAGGTWALQVYSRWGQKLFETAAYQNDWGREAAAGVYYYVLSSRANPASSYKGWVEVVR